MGWFKNKTIPIPGREMIGCGILLKPCQRLIVKDQIFVQPGHKNQVFTSKDTQQTYHVPKNCKVNENVIVQGNQAILRTAIAESWQPIEQFLSINTDFAVSNDTFRVDINTGLAQPFSSTEKDDFYYVLKSYFIPLWELELSDISEHSLNIDIPVPFDYNKLTDYEKCFEQYGTHYVSKVWVGGKLLLVLTVAKSPQLTKQEIRAAVNTLFVEFGDQNYEEETQKASKKLSGYIEHSLVLGQGGNESTLKAGDEKSGYKKWLETILLNPEVIELEVSGIWTLLNDLEKANALKKAYEVTIASSRFTPISAIFKQEHSLYFLRADEYILYSTKVGKIERQGNTREILPNLEDGWKKVDAAFNIEGNQVCLFKDNECACYDLTKKNSFTLTSLSKKWNGLIFDKVDAALKIEESIYFFKDDEYSCYNLQTKKIAEPPKKIREQWHGVIFDKIDAVIEAYGKIYFIRKNEYIRYDLKKNCADSEYPKRIPGSVGAEISAETKENLEIIQLRNLLHDLDSRGKRVQANEIINSYASISAATGLVPIPLVDMAALVFIQLLMLEKLADLYGIQFEKEFVKSLLGSLVGGSTSTWFSIPLASLIKIVPFIGSVSGMISQATLGGASTYAVGKVFIRHFESGGTFLTFDPQEEAEYYTQQLTTREKQLRTH